MRNQIMSLSKIGPTFIEMEQENLGFGDHAAYTNHTTYETAKKIRTVALTSLGIVAIGTLITAALIITLPVSIPVVVSSAVIGSVSGSVGAFAIFSTIHYHNKKNSYIGMMNSINNKIINAPKKLNSFSKTSVISCEDSVESFEWKKKLIQAAQKNIVLSGNYCGGPAFDEVLDLLEVQMREKPDLKVVLLSAKKTINKKNNRKINQLKKNFASQFQLVTTPDIWHIKPGIKKTTNHSKILTIDNGKYFILGGSGIEGKYTYAKGLGDRGSREPDPNTGVLGFFLPRGFRDQDFVFSSQEENGVGRRLFIETLKLSLRWEAINHKKERLAEKDVESNFSNSNSPLKKLMFGQMNPQEDVFLQEETIIEEFETSEKKVSNAKTKIIISGPEHKKSSFEKELLERISNAKNRIMIDHMYFHPTNSILNALADAAKRDVKISIITNGCYSESPKSHRVFGDRNRYNCYKLAKKIGKVKLKNLDVREFHIDQTTLHKKVIVIDDAVIAGSSNLGYKSLVTTSDHEVNFVTDNKDVADQVCEIINVDRYTEQDYLDAALPFNSHDDVEQKENDAPKWYAEKVEHPEKSLGIANFLNAAHHRLMAPLIG